jgi:hypothetical protein
MTCSSPVNQGLCRTAVVATWTYRHPRRAIQARVRQERIRIRLTYHGPERTARVVLRIRCGLTVIRCGAEVAPRAAQVADRMGADAVWVATGAKTIACEVRRAARPLRRRGYAFDCHRALRNPGARLAVVSVNQTDASVGWTFAAMSTHTGTLGKYVVGRDHATHLASGIAACLRKRRATGARPRTAPRVGRKGRVGDARVSNGAEASSDACVVSAADRYPVELGTDLSTLATSTPTVCRTAERSRFACVDRLVAREGEPGNRTSLTGDRACGRRPEARNRSDQATGSSAGTVSVPRRPGIPDALPACIGGGSEDERRLFDGERNGWARLGIARLDRANSARPIEVRQQVLQARRRLGIHRWASRRRRDDRRAIRVAWRRHRKVDGPSVERRARDRRTAGSHHESSETDDLCRLHHDVRGSRIWNNRHVHGALNVDVDRREDQARCGRDHRHRSVILAAADEDARWKFADGEVCRGVAGRINDIVRALTRRIGRPLRPVEARDAGTVWQRPSSEQSGDALIASTRAHVMRAVERGDRNPSASARHRLALAKRDRARVVRDQRGGRAGYWWSARHGNRKRHDDDQANEQTDPRACFAVHEPPLRELPATRSMSADAAPAISAASTRTWSLHDSCAHFSAARRYLCAG